MKFNYLITDEQGKQELEHDIKEMTAMLDSYVSFVRGETPEPIEQIKLKNFIEEICNSIKIEKQEIITNIKTNVVTSGRALQLKRSVMNIIENSLSFLFYYIIC